MTANEATGALMQLSAMAVRSSTGIGRYDSRLYAVYYSKSNAVRLFLGERRISRKAARQYLENLRA